MNTTIQQMSLGTFYSACAFDIYLLKHLLTYLQRDVLTVQEVENSMLYRPP